MGNFWINRITELYEKETVLVKPHPSLSIWYNQMSESLPIIAPVKQPVQASEYVPIVGRCHHMRISKWGLEGVLKMPRKFHKYEHYMIFSQKVMPQEPFWVVIKVNS